MANESSVNLEETFYCTQEDLTMECGSSSTTGNDHPTEGNEEILIDTNSPVARVLAHLDDVLRNRLNLELEEFQQGLHNILDEQMCHVRHLVTISQPAALTQDKQEENKNEGDGEVFWNYQCNLKDERPDESDDIEKTRITLQLMTLCSSISRKIQTPT